MSIPLLFSCLPLLVTGQLHNSTMEQLSLNELLTAIGGETVGCLQLEVDLNDVGIDSRTIRPGNLFWALRGNRHDGHDYVSDAFQKGAAACVVQADKAGRSGTPSGPTIVVPDTLQALRDFARWYRGRQEALIVGVTGSVGKTTTRQMIHAVLSARFVGTQSPRNFNNHIGVPLSLLQITAKHEFAVLELAASSVGEIRDLAGIAAPEVGVVTGIGLAHFATFGSEQNIIDAKGELVEALPDSGFAVLCGDDSRVRLLADRARCPVVFVGENAANDLRATRVEVGRNRLSFDGGGERYAVPVTGRHHITAALTAIAIAREIGMQPDEINAGFRSFVGAPGRCQLEEIGSWTVIDDTYNANPSSMRAACELLRDWNPTTRKLLITGDMLQLGERTAECHRELGRWAAAAGIDCLLVYGEQSEHVIRGAFGGGMETQQLAECRSMDAALAVLDCWLEPGDLVLVKGSRTMRMERVVGWLRDRARSISNENTSRVWTRACA